MTGESGQRSDGPPGGERWLFRVYLAGDTPTSRRTVANLRAIVDGHLSGVADIEVVDLREHPHLAGEGRILAIPTVVREQPEPDARVIGDLSDTAEVLSALGIPRKRTD